MMMTMNHASYRAGTFLRSSSRLPTAVKPAPATTRDSVIFYRPRLGGNGCSDQCGITDGQSVKRGAVSGSSDYMAVMDNVQGQLGGEDLWLDALFQSSAPFHLPNSSVSSPRSFLFSSARFSLTFRFRGQTGSSVFLHRDGRCVSVTFQRNSFRTTTPMSLSCCDVSHTEVKVDMLPGK